MKRLSFFLAALIPFLSLHAIPEKIPQLTLSASATILKPSDELQIKVGVVTLGRTAEEALAENSSKMQSIIDHLDILMLTKDEYETSQFSIRPTYTPCPKNPPPNWAASINGYEVTNTIHIHTSKLDKAGAMIDLANQAGANNITDIRFGLHNPREHWAEALAAAGANAVKDAQAIAAATGVQLIRILSISLNNTQVSSPSLNLSSLARATSVPPPIEPGDVSITANVTVVYEIQ
jgi:hypothetical protein